jgi:3-hydroxyacyl-CoA dehydrogenase
MEGLVIDFSKLKHFVAIHNLSPEAMLDLVEVVKDINNQTIDQCKNLSMELAMRRN